MPIITLLIGRTVQQPGNSPTKWHVYEQILRIPYYIIFSRYTNQLHAFHLVGGHYEPIDINERVPISELGLSLGLWQGNFREINRLWLRWFDASGTLILMPSEEAVAAEQRALAAEQRAEQLAARLRKLGIEE
ncbi:MAG: Uma2 family endonuclease [Coleofasciculus sp. D1-CHI-01]